MSSCVPPEYWRLWKSCWKRSQLVKVFRQQWDHFDLVGGLARLVSFDKNNATLELDDLLKDSSKLTWPIIPGGFCPE